MPLSIEQDNTIKIYPELGKAALFAGDTILFRLWTLIRPQTVSGSISLATVLITLSTIGLTRSAWYHLLDYLHFSVYFCFDTENNVIYFTSLKNLCLHYNTDPGKPVFTPISKFHRIQTFRAAVYASQFTTKPRRISRRTLASESGASPTSQRTYEKLESLNVEPNFVFAYPENSGTLPIPTSLTEKENHSFHSRLANGEEILIWQTINTFRNESRSPASIGQTRKVARSVRCPVAYAQRRPQRPFFVPKLSHHDPNRPSAILVGSAFRFLGHSFSGSLWFSMPTQDSF